MVNIEVERSDGADGKVEIVWKTKDQSALHGKDYMGGEVRYFGGRFDKWNRHHAVGINVDFYDTVDIYDHDAVEN